MTDDSSPTADESHDDNDADALTAATAIDADLDRRGFLRTTGAASAVGLLGSAASNPAVAQAGDWETQADERIEQHRKGDLEVEVEDQSGNPVSDADVSVTMQEHDFRFGTAVNADMYVYGEDKDGNQVSDDVLQKYRRVTHDLFNTAVLENAHKWKFWEDNQQRADDAVDMLLEEELDVRGHVCIWGRTDVGAIPNDVLQAANNGDAETIRQRTHQHIEDIISHYGEDISEWEVVNEAMHVWKLQKGIYGDQIDDSNQWQGEVVPWKSDIMAEWYQTAREAAPESVGLGINDFNVLTPEYDYARTWYPNWATHIEDSGVDLDFMGLQSHMKVTNGEDRRLSPSQLMTELDHYADTVPSLRITEFDFAQSSGSQLTQQEAADYFRKFLKTTFSHPAVEQFLMWGFWDALHWSSPWSPLFDSNFERKPGYDVWMDLVHKEWWTEKEGATDGSGTYATSAFLGEHEVLVETDAGSATETVSVTDSDGTTTVTVTVQGGGTGPSVEPIDGTAPQDIDDDGHYEDLNANDGVDYDDVVAYFEHMDEPAMTDHVEAYDYNGNEEVDYDDLVELFGEVE